MEGGQDQHGSGPVIPQEPQGGERVEAIADFSGNTGGDEAVEQEVASASDQAPDYTGPGTQRVELELDLPEGQPDQNRESDASGQTPSPEASQQQPEVDEELAAQLESDQQGAQEAEATISDRLEAVNRALSSFSGISEADITNDQRIERDKLTQEFSDLNRQNEEDVKTRINKVEYLLSGLVNITEDKVKPEQRIERDRLRAELADLRLEAKRRKEIPKYEKEVAVITDRMLRAQEMASVGPLSKVASDEHTRIVLLTKLYDELAKIDAERNEVVGEQKPKSL